MFFDQACRVVAIGTVELTPVLGTVPEDATVVTQAMAAGAPILV